MTITAVQTRIPPAALEAMAKVIHRMRYGTHLYSADDIACAAFEAMVGAWPKMQHRIHIEQAIIIEQEIILPLTENPDE